MSPVSGAPLALCAQVFRLPPASFLHLGYFDMPCIDSHLLGSQQVEQTHQFAVPTCGAKPWGKMSPVLESHCSVGCRIQMWSLLHHVKVANGALCLAFYLCECQGKNWQQPCPKVMSPGHKLWVEMSLVLAWSPDILGLLQQETKKLCPGPAVQRNAGTIHYNSLPHGCTMY